MKGKSENVGDINYTKIKKSENGRKFKKEVKKEVKNCMAV